MENNELYNGLTATLIGGVERADYETPLRELGFVKIFRSHDNKSLKRMNGFISKSDIAILISGCCSHAQRDQVKTTCRKKNVHYVHIPGSYGPQAVMNYLVDNYSRIKPQL